MVEKIQFQTYTELQITFKHIDLPEMINQEKIRIDLAGINKIDTSIHFFEAETQLHIQLPLIFKNFCDYSYIVCPDVQFDLLDSVTKRQQLIWAKKAGIGIISILDDGTLRIRLPALQKQLKPVIRKEVIQIMNKMFRIRFNTLPLWERSHKTQSTLES
ncbi:MAG: hypothetical protein ACFE9L_01635 [Candidatus Hodarchaeota archaeon]